MGSREVRHRHEMKKVDRDPGEGTPSCRARGSPCTSSQVLGHGYLIMEGTWTKDLEKVHGNEQELGRTDGRRHKAHPHATRG